MDAGADAGGNATLRLRLVNPNTTASMTDTVRLAARAAAPPGIRIEAVTSRRGPAAIQGEADGRAALPGLLDEIGRANAEGVDVVAIACFDDTGINEARSRAAMPVLGIGQAACLAALALGHRYSVVTTLAVSIPVIEANLERAGLAGGLARVRSSGVPVLELERAGGEARVEREARRALDEDGVGTIVLGCAGMAALAARLEARLGAPVIDGVVAAVRLGWAVRRG